MRNSANRRALLTVSLATGMSLLGDTAMYTVLPSHYASIGITLANVGILLSVNRFIRVLLNGPIGLLTDRWPRRWVFVPAVFLGSLSTALYALSEGFWILMAARLIWGVAWAGIWVSGNAIVLDISTEKNRGTFIGRYQFAFFLGAATGAFFGGLLTDLIGYQLAMTSAATVTLSGAIIALFMLPETSRWRSPAKKKSGEVNKHEKSSDIPQLISATALLGVTRLVVAGIMVATIGRYFADLFGEKVIVGQLDVGVATITGVALGLSTLIGMGAAPVAGRLSDRYSSRWGVASGGLTCGATGFSLLAAGTPLAILVGLPLVSISSGSNQGLSTALMGDLSPRVRHGRRLGILYTVGDLASAVGPPLAYALLPLIGLSAVYGLSAGVVGVMLAIALYWTSITRAALSTAG